MQDLNTRTDEIIGAGSRYSMAVERDIESVADQELKIAHLEGLSQIQNKHIEDLNNQLLRAAQENEALLLKKRNSQNQSMEINRRMG
jgi:hypothetical protein